MAQEINKPKLQPPVMAKIERMMTPPGPNSAATRDALDPARLDGTNINPVTGLATDFLNHFNEAIMLLEVLPMAPECKADILAWRPMSYREHFATRIGQWVQPQPGRTIDGPDYARQRSLRRAEIRVAVCQ